MLRDLSASLANEPGLETVNLADFSGIVLTVLEAAVKNGWVDARTPAVRDVGRFVPPLAVRQLIRAVHLAERTVLGELSLEESIGPNGGSWQVADRGVRAAAVDLTAVLAESYGATLALRDPLTTLLAPPLLDFVLEHEVMRARRHRHGISLLLFDVDDLGALNRAQGQGAGDWLLERLGVLARQFFRTHDFVARHGGDSIAALLPETPFDHAATLARRFCEMVRQRLVLTQHRTDDIAQVTVSAAAIGADLVDGELDARTVLAEAEAAVVRAQMNGGNRVEPVGLLPTTLTISGAATLLGVTNRDVTRLIRRGELPSMRRGRHRHIERDAIDEFRRRS